MLLLFWLTSSPPLFMVYRERISRLRKVLWPFTQNNFLICRSREVEKERKNLNFGSIFICEALGNSNQMNIHDAALY
jgi:hypothetical protein